MAIKRQILTTIQDRPWYALCCAVVAFAMLAGCEPPSSSDTGGGAAKPVASKGRSLLDAMAAVYAKAARYEDAGEFHMEFDGNGRRQSSQPFPFSVAFERPNRVRVQAFAAGLVCDGKSIYASLARLENQILVIPAPPKLEWANFTSDKMLDESLRSGLDATLPQLRLLLGDKTLPGFNATDQVSEIADAKLGDESFARVEAKTDAGTTTYWIDPKSYLLRRVEFAVDAIRKEQGENAPSGLKLWADFVNAKFNPKIDPVAFEFEVPKSATLVSRFLAPPPPAPSPLLGKSIDDFSFDDLKEGTIDRTSLEGKVVVFDFWATWCGWCFRGLPNVQKVYDQFKDNDKVAIYAVDTDSPEVEDEKVQQAFDKASLHVPIVRDRKEFSKSAFQVEGLPTMVVLDGKGVIQEIHVGFDPNLADTLPKTIDALLAGQDIAKEKLDEHAKAVQKYEKELSEVTIGATSMVEVPRAEIAARTQPNHFRATPLWTTEDVLSPGNILVVEEELQPAIYVLNASRDIVQLNAAGQRVAKHALKLPTTVGVSYLRTAVDAAGKRYFVVFAATLQELYLFDADWTLVLRYPDSEHAGISDVELADIDGDGKLELLVGYLGVVGVQAATLQGERKWSNRSLENITHLAVTESNSDGMRVIMCANTRDLLSPLDDQGNALPPIRVPGQAVFSVVSAKLTEQASAEICALSLNERDVTSALGLSEKGELLWNYPMPRGVHNQPIELITPGKVPSAEGSPTGAWLLPAADGSIHIIDADGRLLDNFNYGEELTGLATATLDGKSALVVASTKGLTAWQLDPSP